MILNIYQRPFDEEGFKGLEYIALCGEDLNAPYGDVILQCLDQVCIVHMRIYRPSRENIDAFKEDFNNVLREQARDVLKYPFVVTGDIPFKIFDIFKDTVVRDFKVYESLEAKNLKLSSGRGIFLIALTDEIKFKEEEVKRVE